jgi:5'-nucleotidase (lipoprotein e(P4) family)
MRNRTESLLAGLAAAALGGCAAQPSVAPGDNPGLRWVESAAEYRALALQAYGAAAEDLPRMLEDPSWSALPRQQDAGDLPPAIIFDVDETLVSNVQFQMELEPPFTNQKLDDWNAANQARPVPGAAAFVQYAIDSGVEVFFVTNRPCQAKPGATKFCPQEDTTIHDLIETGIPANADRVMMAAEKEDWTREKKVRRDVIARDYRVIMLIGDDLGDFLPCVRATPSSPCTEGATQALREATTDAHKRYWGEGWYIIPNPMHGSWTGVE